MENPLHHLPGAIDILAAKAATMRQQAKDLKEKDGINHRFILFLIIFMIILLGLGYFLFLSGKF